MRLPSSRFFRGTLYALPAISVCIAAWAAPSNFLPIRAAQDGPTISIPPPRLQKGDPRAGQYVFRFETFGDEGFWTDAVRTPQGIMASKITPLQALETGLSFDSERIDPRTRLALARELRTDHSARHAPLLNDPKTMIRLINADAVIGFAVKTRLGEDGGDIEHGGRMGVTCALCHTITDGSGGGLAGHGAIGRREDGRTQHNLNIGGLLAVAANTRAVYPTLQIGPAGATIGRAPEGVPVEPTEAEVDAYLRNPKYYPIGTFDDTPDGIGNSVHVPPLFRQDLSAPYGSSGQNAKLDDISNAVCTVLLDQTTLTTPGGRKFLETEAGAAGLQLSDNYIKVLKKTGVKGYPYIHADQVGNAGSDASSVGLRIAGKKLYDLNAYLADLDAPRGVVTNAASVTRGRAIFRSMCTDCHNVDQSKPVSDVLIPMSRIFPGYAPTVMAQRPFPFSPIQNSMGTFDDKMIIVDASGRGGIRGDALPLLLDLARKPVFLHDDSVSSLNALLDPKRGAGVPHPFYVAGASQRDDVAAFLRSLDTRNRKARPRSAHR